MQLEAGGQLLGHGHCVSWSTLSQQIAALRVLVYLTAVLRSERSEVYEVLGPGYQDSF